MLSYTADTDEDIFTNIVGDDEHYITVPSFDEMNDEDLPEKVLNKFCCKLNTKTKVQ